MLVLLLGQLLEACQHDVNRFSRLYRCSKTNRIYYFFLLYIGILIFAEKITDHHHAYNGRSEITHMNLITCNGTAKIWRSASKNLSYISIFTCRILETLRSIVRVIMQKKSSNHLVYEAEWNYVKMNRCGKCKQGILHYLDKAITNLRNTSYRIEIT